MLRRLAIEFLLGAWVMGCGGATFVPGDADGGPDASSGPGTTGTGTTGTSGSTGSMTATSGTGGSGGATAGSGGAGGTGGGSAGSGGASGDAGIDWSECTGPGQCTPLINGCCSPCGT